jgi:GH24 family phage-related lysozyme (muramidase)
LAQTDGVVKVCRGKTHVVTVSLSATKEEITQKAIEKHRSFDQTFD